MLWANGYSLMPTPSLEPLIAAVGRENAIPDLSPGPSPARGGVTDPDHEAFARSSVSA